MSESHDPDKTFNEAVRHIRYGFHVGSKTHEGIDICGRIGVDSLEELLDAYRQWIQETSYKPRA